MKRRGFLQTLAGLVAAPAIPATKPAEAAITITGTNQFGEAEQDRYGHTLRDGFKSLYEAEYRHMEYGYNAVMRGDSLKFEKVQR